MMVHQRGQVRASPARDCGTNVFHLKETLKHCKDRHVYIHDIYMCVIYFIYFFTLADFDCFLIYLFPRPPPTVG